MTGNAFLKRLMFQLDFLNDEDRETVTRYYSQKIEKASTLLEEEAIVKSFGSPERIAETLRKAFAKNYEEAPTAPAAPVEVSGEVAPEEKAPESEEKESPSHLPEAAPTPAVPEQEPKDEEKPAPAIGTDDVIFSKPGHEEEAPEMIQSLENREIKTLYGEKVIIEERKQPVEEFILEPVDEENGMSPEEIEKAKAETLLKAQNYTTAAFGVPEELSGAEHSPASEEEPMEPASPSTEEEPKKTEEPSEGHEPVPEEDKEHTATSEMTETFARIRKEYVGIFPRMLDSTSLSASAKKAITILLSVVLAPALILPFAGVLLGYAVAGGALVLCGAILFLMMIAGVLAGVLELVYGVSMLFDTVSVALIEIGVGLVFFALVIALVALIYEFLFAVLPKSLKRLTAFLIRTIRILYSSIYGGSV